MHIIYVSMYRDIDIDIFISISISICMLVLPQSCLYTPDFLNLSESARAAFYL